MLHVRERKSAAVAPPIGVYSGCAEECVAFALEFGCGMTPKILLDLKEGCGTVDLVLGDEVNLKWRWQ